MKRKFKIKLFSGLLFLVFFLPLTVSAAGTIDKNEEVSCSLDYRFGDTPLAGVKFRMYLVATVDESGELTNTERFSSYNVDIRGKNDAAWKLLASTLEGYVLRDALEPDDIGETNNAGNMVFPTGSKKLEQGLYLVLGERCEQNGYYFDASPALVMLPSIDMEKNNWNYHVHINGKFQSEKVPEKGTTTSRKVMKIWKDAGYENKRPTEVEVQLLKDGNVYDTVKLNEANQWCYAWNELDSNAKWTVTEKTVYQYNVQIEQQGNTFVVKNTFYMVKDEGEKETNTQKPTNSGVQNGTEESVAQTGQLWWPVPVLLMLGFLCVVVGAARKRRIYEA